MGAWTLTQTFDFDGRSVRHDRWGEGPAVVLVHGTPWSSFNMRHLVRRLARDQALQAMIPGSELRVIDDAGHLVIEEQPDALEREIRSFIGRD